MSSESEGITELLKKARTIAVIGLSSSPLRPSYGVAAYLQSHGYRIIPVNPSYAGTHILGERCHATLLEAAAMLHEQNISIDIVDCFRRSDAIGPIAEAAVAEGVHAA